MILITPTPVVDSVLDSKVNRLCTDAKQNKPPGLNPQPNPKPHVSSFALREAKEHPTLKTDPLEKSHSPADKHGSQP